MKQTISSIFVILTLLLSMTEISSVALMGYTLFTDGEKAAHFCTCIGCSHGDSSDDKTSHCSIDMADTSSHETEEETMHCDMTQTANGASICSCSASESSVQHILFNTHDKTALLANLQYSQSKFKKTVLNFIYSENPESIQRDIFHPPRA